jgi:hypothetical protein
MKKKKKKKKKKKAIRKAIIKLIILSILIKLKIVKFFFFVGQLLKLKFVFLVTINTIINVIRFVMEWKKKRDPEKVMFSYEHAHHQHHYDDQHHMHHPTHEDEDKGWLSGLWSRSGPYDGSDGVRSITYAHDLAYSAQKPTQNSAYGVQEHSKDTAGYALRPARGPIRSAQASAQDSTGYRQTST